MLKWLSLMPSAYRISPSSVSITDNNRYEHSAHSATLVVASNLLEHHIYKSVMVLTACVKMGTDVSHFNVALIVSHSHHVAVYSNLQRKENRTDVVSSPA